MTLLPWETPNEARNRQLRYLRLIARANDVTGWDLDWVAWEHECADLERLVALFPLPVRAGSDAINATTGDRLPASSPPRPRSG